MIQSRTKPLAAPYPFPQNRALLSSPPPFRPIRPANISPYTMAFTSVPPLRAFRQTSRRASPPHSPLRPSPHPRVPRRSCVRAQLVGMPEGFGQSVTPDDNEVLLAEFRFSDPDKLPALVQNNIPKLDESFYNFLEGKINASADIPERDTLRTLRDAITDVMKVLHDDAAKAERIASGTVAGTDGAAVDVSVGGEALATASYDELLKQFAEASAQSPEALKTAIDASYERIDMRLLERLGERIAAGNDPLRAGQIIRDAISVAMNERMAAAMEAVKGVLAAGNPTSMRRAVDTLARKGKIDDAFILLLQANIEQARNAGATQAVEVVQMVLDHASAVKEIGLDPEIRLIRSLLRTQDNDARVEMLMESLKPRGNVTNVDGSATSGVRVDGKKFVTALRKLIEEFGNVDEKFVLKLSEIGEESEAVARKLFDMEDKDVQDLQDEAFHKRSVSIWDLEAIELEEQMQGREASWEGKLGAIPDGFDEQGKMQI